jgi:hypothetical protein
VVFIPVRCDRCYDRSGHLNIIRRQAPDVPPSRWLGGGRVGVLAPLYESSLEAATGATRIPNVQTNKADIIISTLSVTPDRARSLEHAGFRCREEAAFRSLSDSWADTTTPHGRLMLTVLGGLAEFRARAYSRPNRGGSRARERARGAARAEAEADPASSPRLWGAVTQASRWLRLADPATLPIQP